MTAPNGDDPAVVAQQWLANYAAALHKGDATAVADMMQPDGLFRDVLTFSWNSRTLEGRNKIIDFLTDKLPATKITEVKMSDNKYLPPKSAPSWIGLPGIEFAYSYETPISRGEGYVRLAKREDEGWKAYTVSMIVMDLKGHEELTGRYSFEQFTNGKTWGTYLAEQRAQWAKDPYVIVIGGGQIGLQVSARLKQMRISHILIERNSRIGDNWRKRYESLSLHTLKEHHQLLYQPHPKNWPIFPPRDKVASMLETYAITQDLPVWTNSSPVGRPIYDHKKQRWTITINHNGTEVVLHPAHIVLATGTLGAPEIPEMEGRERFSGTVIHSAQFNEPSPFKGQHVVIVGAGNSSVDICQDLAEGGAASVTMIQRSPVTVSSREKENMGISIGFPPDVPVEVCDFKNASTSRGYTCRLSMTEPALKYYWEVLNKDVLEKVEKGGFMVNKNKTMRVLWYERLGGYWMDKGAADLIASGAIKIKPGVEPKAFTKKGIVLSDGSELPADAVIFATGYVNIRDVNKQMFGEEVIDKTSEVWGLDDEGEVRGSYRPSGYPGLWYAAGEFSIARFESKSLAMLIKACELGLYKQS